MDIALSSGVSGNVLAETQPLLAVQSLSVRSRESVHMWPISVGWGWLAIDIISEPLADPDESVGRKFVSEVRNELC